MTFILAILLALLPAYTPTPEGHTVQITVLDSATRQPLERATVTVQGQRKGAYTNDDGVATISGIASGSHFLIIRSIEHHSLCLMYVPVGSDTAKATVVLVPLIWHKGNCVVHNQTHYVRWRTTSDTLGPGSTRIP